MSATSNQRYTWWQANGLRLVILVCVLIVAFPLLWMVLTSFKTPAETMQTPPVWLPAEPTFGAYRSVTEVLRLGRSFLNSAVIATATTAGILVTSLMAGYVFAKHHFRGRDTLFFALIATMFLPPIVTLIPLFRMVGSLGLGGEIAGVILPHLANAFGIFLMRQFILDFPDELIEAARVDGASEFRILFQVVAPSLVPAIAALTMFAFVFHWNSYLWPLTILQGNEANYPIVLSITRLLSYTRSAQNTGLVMAGATLAVVPPLTLFVFLQRHFVRTISRTGITG
ncbi:MAG TPA: carbohydrate ABC transporter permease [Egicoccus sp.]|nr:carbohydrate ABC transporter permease [Egicoccus sp.]HSK23002.1 carbohydrate ABC transporter permease [Egicoccus sp.]